jgi:hypothetical protein
MKDISMQNNTVITKWILEDVKKRFEEAVTTLRHLPNEIRLGTRSTNWEYVYDKSEILRHEPSLELHASGDAIDRLDETMEWLLWISEKQRYIIWARAENKPWKMICAKHGCTRSTANRHWHTGLNTIALQLNQELKQHGT